MGLVKTDYVATNRWVHEKFGAYGDEGQEGLIKVTEMICEGESSRWRLEPIFVSEDEGSTDEDEAGFSASLTCSILI